MSDLTAPEGTSESSGVARVAVALAGVSLLGGLAVSLVAMVLAIVAWVRRDRWRLLRLPLAVFPTLLVLVVLAEAFAME